MRQRTVGWILSATPLWSAPSPVGAQNAIAVPQTSEMSSGVCLGDVCDPTRRRDLIGCSTGRLLADEEKEHEPHEAGDNHRGIGFSSTTAGSPELGPPHSSIRSASVNPSRS